MACCRRVQTSHSTQYTGCTTLSSATIGRRIAHKTLAEQGAAERLERALDNMREASPPVLFAGRWQLLQARTRGGQALVQARTQVS